MLCSLYGKIEYFYSPRNLVTRAKPCVLWENMEDGLYLRFPFVFSVLTKSFNNQALPSPHIAFALMFTLEVETRVLPKVQLTL